MQVWGATAGFTLIEMLVVLVVVAISVALVYPSLFNLRDRFDGMVDSANIEREHRKESFNKFITDGLPLSAYSSARQPDINLPVAGGDGKGEPAQEAGTAATPGAKPAAPSSSPAAGSQSPAASGSGGSSNRPFPSTPPPPTRRSGPSDAFI